MEVINFVVANSETILASISAVLAALMLIVKLTPTPADDEFVGKIQGVFVKIASFLKPKA